MIEGLKFDVTTDELKKHVDAKIAHHKSRAQFYDRQVKALTKGGVEEMPQYSGQDPVRGLRDKLNQHETKLELFEFLRNHLIPNETYRLDQGDLITLEFISRGRF